MKRSFLNINPVGGASRNENRKATKEALEQPASPNSECHKHVPADRYPIMKLKSKKTNVPDSELFDLLTAQLDPGIRQIFMARWG